MKTLFLFFSLGIFSVTAYGQEVIVGQKNKAFTVSGTEATSGPTPEITVKTGTTVRFLNQDNFFHNVFSLSDAKLFDLGSFPQGEYRDVIFDTAGTAEIECAIHPNMKMIVHVED